MRTASGKPEESTGTHPPKHTNRPTQSKNYTSHPVNTTSSRRVSGNKDGSSKQNSRKSDTAQQRKDKSNPASLSRETQPAEQSRRAESSHTARSRKEESSAPKSTQSLSRHTLKEGLPVTASNQTSSPSPVNTEPPRPTKQASILPSSLPSLASSAPHGMAPRVVQDWSHCLKKPEPKPAPTPDPVDLPAPSRGAPLPTVKQVEKQEPRPTIPQRPSLPVTPHPETVDVAEETAESVEMALFLNARRKAARNDTSDDNTSLVGVTVSNERKQPQAKSSPMQSTSGWSQTSSVTSSSTEHPTKTRQKPLEFSLGGFGTNSSQEPAHERILFGSTVAEAVSGSSSSMSSQAADMNLRPEANSQQPMMQMSPQNFSSGYYVGMSCLFDF